MEIKPTIIDINPIPIAKTEIRDALLVSSFFLNALNDAITAETVNGMIINTLATLTYNGPETIFLK